MIWILGLLRRWQVWVGLGVVVLGLVLWAQLGGYIKTRFLREAKSEIEAAREQVKQSDVQIQQMTQQINALKQDAERARQRATAAEARANTAAQRAGQLQAKVLELEAQRRAERRVATLKEAYDALRTLGY